MPLRFADYVEGRAPAGELAKNPAVIREVLGRVPPGCVLLDDRANATYLIDNNTAFTRELAGWALARGRASSTPHPPPPTATAREGMDDKDPALERLRPLNIYGYSKHLFDLDARGPGWLDRIVGPEVLQRLRPERGVQGRHALGRLEGAPGDREDRDDIGLFRSHDPKYADGGQMRDFLYVKDAVEMTLHFAEKGSRASGPL